MNKPTEIKILVCDLAPGMYISSLDRPWLETPFLVQGFTIENEDEIAELGKYCQYVYVHKDIMRRTGLQKNPEIKTRDNRATITKLFSHRKLRSYEDSSEFDEEIKQANVAITKLSTTLESKFSSLKQKNSLKISDVRESVEPMVDSVIRNPDACLWLTRLKTVDNYTYQHAVSAAVWAVALGRHLGLPKVDLQNLAVGVSLFDIGKMKVPERILNKTGKLTETEFKLIQCHVGLGVKMLEESGGINNTILDIVSYHHERHNGSGYPNGMKGNDIPVMARIAAIADCYDAITSERPYAKPMSPGLAVNRLYEWRGNSFQSELVEEFIQAIGIYPAGTLIELSNGCVAVVLSEYRTRRLRPKIIQLLDANKHPIPTPKVIDLLATTHDTDGKPLDIVDSLEPGTYDLDLQSLKMYQGTS
jgi:HD-GYP domain-containing protein (c-di-GMP phosphodiesterase class II)